MLERLWQDKVLRRDILIVLAIGTVLSLITPFGVTNHLPFYQAWLYWVGLLAWGWVAAMVIGPWLQQKLHNLHEALLYLLVSIVIALWVMPVIVLVQHLIGHGIPPGFWPRLYFLIWVISIAVTGIAWLSDRAFSQPEAEPDGSAFMARIPARLAGGDLLAISSEDHYLRIHTSRGSDLILMRLSDAISELNGYDGMQVHRSWWVARSGIADFSRDQGKILFTLRDEQETQVPVSRTFAKKVRAAGWLG